MYFTFQGNLPSGTRESHVVTASLRYWSREADSLLPRFSLFPLFSSSSPPHFSSIPLFPPLCLLRLLLLASPYHSCFSLLTASSLLLSFLLILIAARSIFKPVLAPTIVWRCLEYPQPTSIFFGLCKKPFAKRFLFFFAFFSSTIGV